MNRRDIAIEAGETLRKLAPADPKQLKLWTLQVLNRYRDFNDRDPRMKAVIQADWIETFSGYPIVILDRIWKLYREGPYAGRMPLEGQLIAMLEGTDAKWSYYRDVAQRISRQDWFSAALPAS